MSENEFVKSGNFIHDIIDKDMGEETYGGKVYTRFPPKPNKMM